MAVRQPVAGRVGLGWVDGLGGKEKRGLIDDSHVYMGMSLVGVWVGKRRKVCSHAHTRIYTYTQPYAARRAALQQAFGFSCRCPRCRLEGGEEEEEEEGSAYLQTQAKVLGVNNKEKEEEEESRTIEELEALLDEVEAAIKVKSKHPPNPPTHHPPTQSHPFSGKSPYGRRGPALVSRLFPPPLLLLLQPPFPLRPRARGRPAEGRHLPKRPVLVRPPHPLHTYLPTNPPTYLPTQPWR